MSNHIELVKKFVVPHVVGMEFKRFCPRDNSYSICYDDEGGDYLLAGNINTPPEEVLIYKGPYTLRLRLRDYIPHLHIDAYKTYPFVDVICKRGLRHRVLAYGLV